MKKAIAAVAASVMAAGVLAGCASSPACGQLSPEERDELPSQTRAVGVAENEHGRVAYVSPPLYAVSGGGPWSFVWEHDGDDGRASWDDMDEIPEPVRGLADRAVECEAPL